MSILGALIGAGVGALNTLAPNLLNTATQQVSSFVNQVNQNLQYVTQTTNTAINTVNSVLNSTTQQLTGQTMTSGPYAPQPFYYTTPQQPNVYIQQPVQYVPYQQQTQAPLVDFNTLMGLVNTIFSQIPNLVATIQNPIQSPYLTLLTNLINQATTNFTAITNTLQTSISRLEQAVYNSSSGVARQFGVDVGQYSGLLDAAVQTAINTFLPGNQAAINQMVALSTNQASQYERSVALLSQQMTQSVKDIVDNFKVYTGQVEETPDEKHRSDQVALYNGLVDVFQFLRPILTPQLQKIADTLKKVDNVASFDYGTRIEDIREVVDNLRQGKYHTIDEFNNALFGTGVQKDIIYNLVTIATLIPTIINVINESSGPVVNRFRQLINASTPTMLIGLGELIDSYHRGLIGDNEYYERVSRYGINRYDADIINQTRRKYPDVTTMIQNMWRGYISPETFKKQLLESGLTADASRYYLNISEVIPPLQDIIQMAVKDVFSPELVAEFGHFNELPDEFVKWSQKQGLSLDWSRYYWGSHWHYPSAEMGFDMLHRGIISEEQLSRLLKALDFIPGWRDEIIKLSYNVLTRVDIRRMYKAGVLNEQQMHRAHLDIGVNEQTAQFLDEFVKRTNLPEDETELTALEKRVKTAIEKAFTIGKITDSEAVNMLVRLGVDSDQAQQIIDVLQFENAVNDIQPIKTDLSGQARTVVVSAYKKGNLSKTDCQQFLIGLGLSESEANQQIAFMDLENAVRLKSMAQDTAQKLFANYTITEVEFNNRLNALGFSPAETYMAFSEALLMRDNRTKQLTATQLKKLFVDGVIDVDQFGEKLKGLGYTDEAVLWLLQDTVLIDLGA